LDFEYFGVSGTDGVVLYRHWYELPTNIRIERQYDRVGQLDAPLVNNSVLTNYLTDLPIKAFYLIIILFDLIKPAYQPPY